MIDQHFSPPILADKLAGYLKGNPSTVFDPAMGEGALLHAVQQRWPSIGVFGADIDQEIVSTARQRFPDWNISRADVLNPNSRKSSKVWRDIRRDGIDYVVLNPPFSFRGNGGPRLTLNNQEFRSTPSIAFLATALLHGAPRKGALAILPAGALHSHRDQKLVRQLENQWKLEVLEQLPRGTFQGVAASSVIVRAERRTGLEINLTKSKRIRSSQHCKCVEIIRGRVPVASAQVTSATTGVPWIHTTLIREWNVDQTVLSSRWKEATNGPLVVLPRVGQFDSRKISTVGDSPIVLSDCVFGLRPLGSSPEELAKAMIFEGESLRRNYLGTGAPHITIGRLSRFLEDLGFVSQHVSASALRGSCSCDAKRNSPQPETTTRTRITTVPDFA